MYRLMLTDAPVWTTSVEVALECGPFNRTPIRARTVAYYYLRPPTSVRSPRTARRCASATSESRAGNPTRRHPKANAYMPFMRLLTAAAMTTARAARGPGRYRPAG